MHAWNTFNEGYRYYFHKFLLDLWDSVQRMKLLTAVKMALSSLNLVTLSSSPSRVDLAPVFYPSLVLMASVHLNYFN